VSNNNNDNTYRGTKKSEADNALKRYGRLKFSKAVVVAVVKVACMGKGGYSGWSN